MRDMGLRTDALGIDEGWALGSFEDHDVKQLNRRLHMIPTDGHRLEGGFLPLGGLH